MVALDVGGHANLVNDFCDLRFNIRDCIGALFGRNARVAARREQAAQMLAKAFLIVGLHQAKVGACRNRLCNHGLIGDGGDDQQHGCGFAWLTVQGVKGKLEPFAQYGGILDGKRIRNETPAEAIRNGFAMLTEERRASGIFGILDITENTTISSLGRFRRGPFLSDGRMRRATDGYIKRMKIKTASQATKIRSLSGGNQQKVILSRWLLTEPRILLLDEPTRGIDVGAKYEIYTLLCELAASGKGIIAVSSEMPELLGICDRIIVMSGGRIAGEVDAKNATQDQIMTLATKYV